MADAEVYFRGGHDERGSTHLAIKGLGALAPSGVQGLALGRGGQRGFAP